MLYWQLQNYIFKAKRQDLDDHGLSLEKVFCIK